MINGTIMSSGWLSEDGVCLSKCSVGDVLDWLSLVVSEWDNCKSVACNWKETVELWLL